MLRSGFSESGFGTMHICFQTNRQRDTGRYRTGMNMGQGKRTVMKHETYGNVEYAQTRQRDDLLWIRIQLGQRIWIGNPDPDKKKGPPDKKK
jgi:hypothetical protein